MYAYSNLDVSNNNGALILHYNKDTKKTTTFIITVVDVSHNTINKNISEWSDRPINYFHEVDRSVYNVLHYNEIFSTFVGQIPECATIGSWLRESIVVLLHCINRILPIDLTQFVDIEIVEDKETFSISQYAKDGYPIGNTITFDKEDF